MFLADRQQRRRTAAAIGAGGYLYVLARMWIGDAAFTINADSVIATTAILAATYLAVIDRHNDDACR